MSTRFYAGQQDYIIQLNLLDDSFNNVYGTIAGKADANNGVHTGTTTMQNLYFSRITAAARGIQWYNSTNNTWQQYMASGGGTSQGPKGNLTAPTGTLVTGWALRSVVDSAAGNGWTFETNTSAGTAPAIVAEIDSSGNAKFAGTVTAPTFSGTATIGSTIPITNDTTTNATYYPTWVTGTSSGTSVKISSTKLSFNPSTGTLSSTTFSGALSGTATNSTNAAITNDNATAVSVYPMWVTGTSGNLPAKVSSTNFQFVPSTGAVTLTGTGSSQLTMSRTGSAINTVVSYTNTSGTVYAGHGAANTFAVGGANDLTSSPWFRVNSTDGTFSGNLTVGGNLIVNGTTTTVNSTTVTIDDPIFTLGGDTAPTSDDNKDRGIEFRWHNGTVAKVGFFGFDDSTGRFTFIPDGTNTSEVYSGAVGTIEANLLGNVTGNASGTAANVTGTVAVANGGTGGTTAATARSGIGAAVSGANNDITTLTALTTAFTLPAGCTAAGLLGSTSPAVAAAGSTQGTATALTSDLNIVTSGTGGVVVPGATSGKYAVIVNRTGSAINVYPASGHSFDGLSANTAISLPASAFIELYGSSTTQWHSTYQAVTQGQFVVGNISGNAANVTGTVAVANGGTGATTAAGACTNLGAVPYASMTGGRSFVTHDFSTYIQLYETKFINRTGSTNLPAQWTNGNGYLIGIGAGDTGSRGFELLGTSVNQLMFRERQSGTWAEIYHSSNTVPATNGGTGQTSYAVGDLLYAATTTTVGKLADVATGNVLISGGVGVAPSYGKVGLTTHVSGTLAVANGGTGVTSSTGTGSVVLSASPTLTGTVTIPTAAVGDSSTAAASTAFTQQAAADAAIVYSIVFG